MSVNHQSHLSAGVMPGEQQSPPAPASTEMPQEEMTSSSVAGRSIFSC